MTISSARRARDQSRLNLIDYVLMAVGSGLAAYTAGMAINRPDTAQFLGIGVVAGTGLSYLIRTILGNTAFVKVDGILYAAAIACAIVGFPVLNGMLPEEGFARDVMMAGVLAWMLVLGSVLTWRDGTLLFQAIPSVALFGLVGCYDTYSLAPYLFFGFLVCLAILLARANRREMMRQAVESGYFNRADAPSAPRDFPEQSPELYEDIKHGPWRWQAGPEWALASALVIVLLSGIGAPVLQEAAKPITGAVRIMAPSTLRTRLQQASNDVQETSYNVGRGPLGSLSERVLYEAQLDKPRYMRTAAYEQYNGHGWQTTTTPVGVPSTVEQSIRAMGENRQTVPFAVRPTTQGRQIPLPAEPIQLDRSTVWIRPDGGGVSNMTDRDIVHGVLVEPTKQPSQVDSVDPQYFDISLVPDSVRQFAQKAAGNDGDDYERARRIAMAISSSVRYNLNAPAVPSGVDPAEYFLFQSKEGYCDLFATAMTLCARSSGMPARYVIGYLPEMSNGAGGYVLREADYHAWCEIFFQGVGWVVFDATSGADQVEGGERGSSDEKRPWFRGAWVEPAARTICGVLVIAVLATSLKKLKPQPKAPRHDARQAYRRFERAIRRALGRRRRPGETVAAYVASATEMLGDPVRDLGTRFGEALYGPKDPSAKEVDALNAAVKSLRKIRPGRVSN